MPFISGPTSSDNNSSYVSNVNNVSKTSFIDISPEFSNILSTKYNYLTQHLRVNAYSNDNRAEGGLYRSTIQIMFSLGNDLFLNTIIDDRGVFKWYKYNITSATYTESTISIGTIYGTNATDITDGSDNNNHTYRNLFIPIPMKYLGDQKMWVMILRLHGTEYRHIKGAGIIDYENNTYTNVGILDDSSYSDYYEFNVPFRCNNDIYMKTQAINVNNSSYYKYYKINDDMTFTEIKYESSSSRDGDHIGFVEISSIVYEARIYDKYVSGGSYEWYVVLYPIINGELKYNSSKVTMKVTTSTYAKLPSYPMYVRCFKFPNNDIIMISNANDRPYVNTVSKFNMSTQTCEIITIDSNICTSDFMFTYIEDSDIKTDNFDAEVFGIVDYENPGLMYRIASSNIPFIQKVDMQNFINTREVAI